GISGEQPSPFATDPRLRFLPASVGTHTPPAPPLPQAATTQAEAPLLDGTTGLVEAPPPAQPDLQAPSTGQAETPLPAPATGPVETPLPPAGP
ncbi:MAG: hypothetical protein WC943_16085, partial [Elusimicrobiota bacterium]